MDTRDLPQAKNDLEIEIGEFVRSKLRQFKKETGLAVLGVDLVFRETTAISDISPQTSLTEVRTDISL